MLWGEEKILFYLYWICTCVSSASQIKNYKVYWVSLFFLDNKKSCGLCFFLSRKKKNLFRFFYFSNCEESFSLSQALLNNLSGSRYQQRGKLSHLTSKKKLKQAHIKHDKHVLVVNHKRIVNFYNLAHLWYISRRVVVESVSRHHISIFLYSVEAYLIVEFKAKRN